MAASQDQDGTIPCAQADYLEQDPVIRGQRFACISFVSPNTALASKEAFCVHKFMSKLASDVKEMLDSMEVVFRDHLSVMDTIRMLRERHGSLWNPADVQEEFRLFKEHSEAELDEEFRSLHGNFKTTIQGFKIRGVFDTLEAARDRSQKLKVLDGKFNVFVAEVGCWCPWDPSSTNIENVEYAETHLNTLVKKYHDQSVIRDEMYTERKNSKLNQIDQDREVWLDRARQERQKEADLRSQRDTEALSMQQIAEAVNEGTDPNNEDDQDKERDNDNDNNNDANNGSGEDEDGQDKVDDGI